MSVRMVEYSRFLLEISFCDGLFAITSWPEKLDIFEIEKLNRKFVFSSLNLKYIK